MELVLLGAVVALAVAAQLLDPDTLCGEVARHTERAAGLAREGDLRGYFDEVRGA